MRTLLLTLVLLFPLTAFAQELPTGEFTAGYQHAVAFAGGESRQFPGWSFSGGRYVTDSLAIVAMVTGGYASETVTYFYTERGRFGTTIFRSGSYDVDLSVLQFMGGIQETYRRSETVRPFVRGLVGLEQFSDSFGDSYTDTAFVTSSGIGVDVGPPRTALRVAVDYRHAYGYEGMGTHDFVLTAGLVVGFGSR